MFKTTFYKSQPRKHCENSEHWHSNGLTQCQELLGCTRMASWLYIYINAGPDGGV